MSDGCNLRKHSEQRFCCDSCKRAFSSMQVFDWHRRGGECRDPRESNGIYVGRVIPGKSGDVTVWGVAGVSPWATAP